jgi:hypothetical protein
LLCKEVLAPVGKYSIFYSSSPLFSAHTINGTESLAEIAATGFEQLTLRQDLRYSTFLIWRQVLSPLKLLRTSRAWCAFCYEEQLTEMGYAYEPLIWSIAAISICYKHHELLCDLCPHCGNQLILLATDYRPGYCSKCREWLGIKNASKFKFKSSSSGSLNSAELTRQILILDFAGELLSHAPNISSPPTQQIFLN